MTSIKKLIFILFLILTTVSVCGVVFIKTNTSVAAEFSDNILRPLIGNNTVIFLEKIFFNVSDRIQQLTSNNSAIISPISNFDFLNNDSSKNLDISQIQTNNSFTKLKNEGNWKILNLGSFPNLAVIAQTFVRPDPIRPYSVVTIAQIDMSQMRLGLVAGTKEPGGKIGNPGPGVVPNDIVKNNRLVAAFDGGFQYRDGQYGMVVDGKTYLPLKSDLGTIVGYKNGNLKIIDYTGQDLGKDIAFIRQNCPILIKDGQLGVNDIKNKKLWGRTPTTDIYTWRTGLGLTKNGNLLFAVGNNLTPETLAIALQMAGAENAIQLDINPNWVRFNLFSPLGDGKYSSKPLTRDLKDGSQAYLNGYSKDFFYLYKK